MITGQMILFIRMKLYQLYYCTFKFQEIYSKDE